MKRYYKIYGMLLASDVKIEEALELAPVQDEQVDVWIETGDFEPDVKAKLDETDKQGSFSFYRHDSMFFHVEKVASYHVTKQRICVKPEEGADLMEVKTFLLGSALGYCMNLRNMVVIHGGAVCKNGKGLIVTGESGAGKSTLSCALRNYGYDFIADDVCAISESEAENPHINLAYPQQKLCRDAALRQGYDLSELIYINEERDKFAIRLKDGFMPDGADFHVLYEIVLSDEQVLSVREINGHEKLFALIRNIYRGESSFEMWGVPPHYMKACATIASKIRIYQISRPKEGNALDEMISFVEQTIGEGEKS